MATESPIRMLEARGKWASHRGASNYSSAAKLAVDEAAVLVSGHKYRSGRDNVPSRSGSAPPNMEGSITAIENLMQNSGFTANLTNVDYDKDPRGMGGQFISYSSPDLSYPYHAGFSPQFHHFATSGFDQQFMSNNAGNQLALASVRGSSDNFFHSSRAVLPTHKEESEDERSPLKSSDDVTDVSLAVWSGQDSSTFIDQTRVMSDLRKDESTCMSSPVNDQENALQHASVGLGSVNRDSENPSFHEELTRISTPVGTGISADDSASISSRQGSSPSMLEGQNNLTRESDNKSPVGGDSDVTGLQTRIKALKVSCPPAIDTHGARGERQQNFQSNLLPHQQGGNLQYQASVPQVVSHGTNSSDVLPNHYFHGGRLPSTEVQPVLHLSGFTPPLYATAAATYMPSASPYYTSAQPPGVIFPSQYGMGGYPYSPGAVPSFLPAYPSHSTVPLPFEGVAAGSDVNTQISGSWESTSHMQQHMNKFYGQLGFAQPFVDPRLQFHQSIGDAYNLPGQPDPLALRGGVVGNHMSAFDSQVRPDFASVAPDPRSQLHGVAGQSNVNQRRGAIVGADYTAVNLASSFYMTIPNSALASPVLPGSPIGGNSFPGGRSDVSSPSSGRSVGYYSGWQGQRGLDSFNYQKPYSFLEELKSGKGRRFDLSDITGHVAEFSVDQHGSRFIQQKLENCSLEDKASVFQEVLPHACKLMTDVFGNYVIQKFFEYGTPDQRRDLAKALTGQILPLSLQMYGCRVIQKALDVIELDQKIELVLELDGHVMRCVRDQNGNHVIQKCIECVPSEKIGFIISSFCGQVASLSMHPYGCRVIQRVLEHCTDELQSQFIVDEILESVCTLAQDQYGNYVTQHVLERGKQQERSQIIKNLSGKVVQMSQHKFASNVVEKCLEYGDASSRELLINEVIGSNEGNDNLLVMMKDQYANYVVQKILEKCTDSQRDLLLGRIRVHLTGLKKYTYGKHIVARFEQLFGEMQEPASS